VKHRVCSQFLCGEPDPRRPELDRDLNLWWYVSLRLFVVLRRKLTLAQPDRSTTKTNADDVCYGKDSGLTLAVVLYVFESVDYSWQEYARNISRRQLNRFCGPICRKVWPVLRKPVSERQSQWQYMSRSPSKRMNVVVAMKETVSHTGVRRSGVPVGERAIFEESRD
jgi:hypothetical protein